MIWYILTTVVSFSLVSCYQFQFLSTYHETLWVGVQPMPNMDLLEDGGFILHPGEKKYINGASDAWAGKFWGRTGCSNATGKCLTGDCYNGLKCNGSGAVPPCSYGEINLNVAGLGQDFYDISLVNGFNIPMAIQPIRGKKVASNPSSCKRIGCNIDLNRECPEDLRVEEDGRTIACTSACVKYGTSQYCCTDSQADPYECKSHYWPIDYPRYFKDKCPDVYTYPYDEPDYLSESLFSCKASAYIIIFG